MEHSDGEDTFQRPYYPAIVEVIREMLARSANALDAIKLAQHLKDSLVEKSEA